MAGEVVVYDPRAGEVRGHDQLRRFVRRSRSVLAEHLAGTETVASIAVGDRAVVELLAHMAYDGRELLWPVAVVAESPNDRSVVFRSYFSRWMLDGLRHLRPAILKPGPALPGDIVGRYQAALDAGRHRRCREHLHAERVFPRAHRGAFVHAAQVSFGRSSPRASARAAASARHPARNMAPVLVPPVVEPVPENQLRVAALVAQHLLDPGQQLSATTPRTPPPSMLRSFLGMRATYVQRGPPYCCVMETELPASADDVASRLGDTGYLCDDALATVAFLALRMERPLLLEGEPGTGKTALAEAIAESLHLLRLQCLNEGIDATQVLYARRAPAGCSASGS